MLLYNKIHLLDLPLPKGGNLGHPHFQDLGRTALTPMGFASYCWVKGVLPLLTGRYSQDRVASMVERCIKLGTHL